MKQVSHPPFLGIVDHKMWCPFFIRASKDPFFFTRKQPFSVNWGAKKWVFGRPNKKTDTTFCRQKWLFWGPSKAQRAILDGSKGIQLAPPDVRYHFQSC